MWSRVEKMLHGISGVKHGKRSLSGLMRRKAGAGATGSGAAGAGAEGADAALEASPVSGTIELPWEGGLAERQPPMALGERAASSQRRLGEYIRLCVEKRVSAPKVWEARAVTQVYRSVIEVWIPDNAS